MSESFKKAHEEYNRALEGVNYEKENHGDVSDAAAERAINAVVNYIEESRKLADIPGNEALSIDEDAILSALSRELGQEPVEVNVSSTLKPELQKIVDSVKGDSLRSEEELEKGVQGLYDRMLALYSEDLNLDEEEAHQKALAKTQDSARKLFQSGIQGSL